MDTEDRGERIAPPGMVPLQVWLAPPFCEGQKFSGQATIRYFSLFEGKVWVHFRDVSHEGFSGKWEMPLEEFQANYPIVRPDQPNLNVGPREEDGDE